MHNAAVVYTISLWAIPGMHLVKKDLPRASTRLIEAGDRTARLNPPSDLETIGERLLFPKSSSSPRLI